MPSASASAASGTFALLPSAVAIFDSPVAAAVAARTSAVACTSAVAACTSAVAACTSAVAACTSTAAISHPALHHVHVLFIGSFYSLKCSQLVRQRIPGLPRPIQAFTVASFLKLNLAHAAVLPSKL